MNHYHDEPMVMIAHDELYNILKALRLTGGCDERTLAIVAQAVGLPWPPDRSRVEVERPVFLLEAEK